MCELRLLRKDAPSFWVRIDIVAKQRIEDMTELRAIIIDISQRKQGDNDIENLNRLLTQNLVRLRLADEEMEAFSYSVSHDCVLPSAI